MILATALLWSAGGTFVKVLTLEKFGYQMDPRAVACLRSAAAGLFLAWALPRLRGAPRWRAAASGLAYTVVVGSFVVATAWTSAANAIFLQYAYPLFVAVGAVVLFHERLGRRTQVALALGLAGVAVILVFSWSADDWAGLLWGLTSSVTFAALALLQHSIKRGSPIALCSLYNLTAAALMLPLAWGHLGAPPAAYLLVATMGILQLGVPYVLFIAGMRRVRATDGALITLVEPILNPVWVWLIVGEPTGRATLVGGAFILVALVVRFVGLRRRP